MEARQSIQQVNAILGALLLNWNWETLIADLIQPSVVTFLVPAEQVTAIPSAGKHGDVRIKNKICNVMSYKIKSKRLDTCSKYRKTRPQQIKHTTEILQRSPVYYRFISICIREYRHTQERQSELQLTSIHLVCDKDPTPTPDPPEINPD